MTSDYFYFEKKPSIMLSIMPKYCELIAAGLKKVEVRKTKPSIETPFKSHIYVTKSNLIVDREAYINRLAGKIIGEFICNKIDKIVHAGTSHDNLQLCIVENDWTYSPLSNEYLFYQTQLTIKELEKYSNGGDLYGWHISNPIIYDEPKELSQFGLKRPPQSWCYLWR